MSYALKDLVKSLDDQTWQQTASFMENGQIKILSSEVMILQETYKSNFLSTVTVCYKTDSWECFVSGVMVVLGSFHPQWQLTSTEYHPLSINYRQNLKWKPTSVTIATYAETISFILCLQLPQNVKEIAGYVISYTLLASLSYLLS